MFGSAVTLSVAIAIFAGATVVGSDAVRPARPMIPDAPKRAGDAPVVAAQADALVDAIALPPDGHVTDHLIAQLTPEFELVAGIDGVEIRTATGNRHRAHERAIARAGIDGATPALTRAPRHPEVARAVGLDRFIRLRVAPGHDAIAAAKSLRALKETFARVDVDPLGGLAATGPVIPDDPAFGLQWSLWNVGQTVAGVPGQPGADIGITHGWLYTTGDPVLVAVLDSGVNLHPELEGRVVGGFNVPNPGGPTVDICQSHGTHVSGILAAAGQNAEGIAGVSWAAEIMPVIIVDPCSGPESMVADGLVWATDEGARIANMSLQYNVGSAFLKSAVEYAHALDVILVAATGNNAASQPAFPARWPETIAVAATNNLDEHWPSSNFGPQVDLAAPGVFIWSLIGTSSYGYKTGTSMATPLVSGAVALMLSINPTLSNEQVRQLLRATADDVGAPGFDPFTGYGRLNVESLLIATLETLAPTADLNGDGVVDGADLGILLNAWGTCAGSPCLGDLNGDGVVDGADLGILLSAWGSGPPS